MLAVEIVNLRKYYGKSRGIEDVTLSVPAGEVFGFIGPNGAGKSTTIRIMLNFIFPDSGHAKVLGLDVVKDTKQIRSLVGYLPAEVGYYEDMTVRALLEYATGFHRIDPANARKRINELSEAFELDLSRPTYALSSGNRRKTGIVLALLHRPKLLILDEPTASLDPLMQARLFEVLSDEHRRGTTVFFSSHVLSEVQKFCHRVAIIKEGRVIRVEDVSTLRAGQFQKVRAEFVTASPPLVDLDGVVHQQQRDRELEVLYKGNVNDLIRFFARHELASLTIAEPDLEEVFMHYYQTGGESS